MISIGDLFRRTEKTNPNFTQGKEYKVVDMDSNKVYIRGDRGIINSIYFTAFFKNFEKAEIKTEVKGMKKVKEFTILEVISVDKFVWDRAFNNDNNWYEVKLKVRTVNGNEKVVDKLFTCCEWDRIKRMGAFYGV